MSNEILDIDGSPSGEMPEGRPVFLTTICILTFIGSGLGILLNFVYFFQYQNPDSLTRMSLNILNIDADSMAMTALVQAGLSVGTLFGALMMWQQKKSGFITYVVSTALFLIMPILIIGGSYFNLGGFIVVSWIFPLAFIGMYAANLKALK